MQTILRYNTPLVSPDNGFTLSAVTSFERLEVCTAYTGTRHNTGMVLVEVELLTGWEAVSPERLINEVDTVVQRVEQDEKNNMVVLYFDQIARQQTCVSFEVKEVTNIKDRKDAMVTVYDYYNRDETATVLYNV